MRLSKALTLEEGILNYLDSEEFQGIYQKYLNHVEKLKENALTGKLWMQYYDILNIIVHDISFKLKYHSYEFELIWYKLFILLINNLFL